MSDQKDRQEQSAECSELQARYRVTCPRGFPSFTFDNLKEAQNWCLLLDREIGGASVYRDCGPHRVECAVRLPDPVNPSLTHTCSRVGDHRASPVDQHWDFLTDMTWTVEPSR